MFGTTMVNEPDQYSTTLVNEPGLPVTTMVDTPDQPSTTLVNEPGLPVTTMVDTPDQPSTTLVNEPGLPVTTMVNKPDLPETVGVNDPGLPVINPASGEIMAVPIKIKDDEDYDIHNREILFFNLFSLQYNKEISAEGFYEQYRNVIVANLKKKGDIIVWQNDTILVEDEQLSPTFEELILANVLGLINAGLPAFVLKNYYRLIGKTKSLMDYKADILDKVPTFLNEINGNLPAVLKSDADIPSR
jgi:hypothetical protein